MFFRKFLLGLAFVLGLAVLASCGGGGGSPGLSSGTAIFSTAPATGLTVKVGSSQSYNVRGGSGNYQAISSREEVATANVDGDTLFIYGNSTGVANISVVDTANKSYNIALTVGNLLPFYTTAPSTLIVAPGTSQSFVVGGGVPFTDAGSPAYRAVSNDPKYVTVNMVGSTLTITGQPLTGQASASATVTLSDKNNTNQLTVAVTVASIPLTVTPSSITGAPGDILVAAVLGGTPPYTAVAENVSLVLPTFTTINRLELAVNAFDTNNAATKITITDAMNQTVNLDLNVVIFGGRTFGLSPSALSVSELDSAAIELRVFGGKAPYRVYSSNPLQLSATISGKVVTVSTGTSRCLADGATGSVTITVVDDNGARGTSVISIINDPSTVTCP
jgi:hypothetical protein